MMPTPTGRPACRSTRLSAWPSIIKGYDTSKAMRRIIAIVFLAAISLLWIAWAQLPQIENPSGPRMKREQMEALLKHEHQKSLEDAAELMKLSEELKIDLEKNDRHVLSMNAMKKAEEIEKIAKRIRGRMKRF
jgi:hypothetical protein